MTVEQLAWFAGVVDGEGCFRISEKRFDPIFAIKMNHLPTIKKLRRLAGGGHLYRNLPRENSKTSWTWRLNGRAATSIVLQLIPFLYTKKREARLFLKALRWLGKPVKPRERKVLVRKLAGLKHQEFVRYG